MSIYISPTNSKDSIILILNFLNFISFSLYPSIFVIVSYLALLEDQSYPRRFILPSLINQRARLVDNVYLSDSIYYNITTTPQCTIENHPAPVTIISKWQNDNSSHRSKASNLKDST